MLVAIHQPHYLPWLGYLHRMAQADLFIVLDHVQFERGNYQNRTQVRVNGAAHWLTVPVVQRSQKERIDEKLIDTRQDWDASHFETLRRAYGQAAVAPLRAIYETPWERLVDLNDAMLQFLRARLNAQLAEQHWNAFLTALREQAKIVDNRNKVLRQAADTTNVAAS